LPLVPVLALRRTDRESRVLPPNRRAGAGGRTRQPPAGAFVTW